MTAHQLAAALLKGPDLPVIINGWGSEEGDTHEVSEPLETECSFEGVSDDSQTPRNRLGYPIERKAVFLNHK